MFLIHRYIHPSPSPLQIASTHCRTPHLFLPTHRSNNIRHRRYLIVRAVWTIRQAARFHHMSPYLCYLWFPYVFILPHSVCYAGVQPTKASHIIFILVFYDPRVFFNDLKINLFLDF